MTALEDALALRLIVPLALAFWITPFWLFDPTRPPPTLFTPSSVMVLFEAFGSRRRSARR